LKLSGKRTVTGQNSGELYTKKHRRGNSQSLGKPLQNLLKELFPNHRGRIFQVKGQSKKVILLFSCSVLLFTIVENRFINVNLYLLKNATIK